MIVSRHLIARQLQICLLDRICKQIEHGFRTTFYSFRYDISDKIGVQLSNAMRDRINHVINKF